MTSPIDLPISIINDIIKSNIDSDVLLSKNTKLAFSRIGGVFIMYLSHLALENAKKKKRVKITIKDVKDALIQAGFEDFIEKLDEFMRIYENEQGNDNENQVIDNDINEKDEDEGQDDNLCDEMDVDVDEVEVEDEKDEKDEENRNGRNKSRSKGKNKSKENKDCDQVKEVKTIK